MQELSRLTIRELFAELTRTEDALRGVAGDGESGDPRHGALLARQEKICRELRSRAGSAGARVVASGRHAAPTDLTARRITDPAAGAGAARHP